MATRPVRNNGDFDPKTELTMKQAIAEGHWEGSEPHFRMKVVLAGKIKFRKVAMKGTNIPRIYLDRASFEAYMREHPRQPRFVITDEEKAMIVALRAKKVSNPK